LKQFKTSNSIFFSACWIVTTLIPSVLLADSVTQSVIDDGDNLHLFMTAEEQRLAQNSSLENLENPVAVLADSAADDDIPDPDSHTDSDNGENRAAGYSGVVMRGSEVLDVWVDGRRHSNPEYGHRLFSSVQSILSEEDLAQFITADIPQSRPLSRIPVDRDDGFSDGVSSE